MVAERLEIVALVNESRRVKLVFMSGWLSECLGNGKISGFGVWGSGGPSLLYISIKE